MKQKTNLWRLLSMFHSVLFMANSEYTYILLSLIGLDFFTGYLKAIIWKVADSWIGLKGIVKHITTFFIYFFIGAFFHYIDSFTMGKLFLVIICLNYSLSILENVGVMGVYVPKFLKTKIQAELKRYEEKLDEEDK